MNHFSVNLPPSDTTALWYSATMDNHHHHGQPPQRTTFPLFYHHQSPLSLSSAAAVHPDDDSDNSTSNYAAAAATANNDNRSETSSSQSQHHHQQQQLHHHHHSVAADHREHMFEKPLTPSDVGKLNRLVIPKQHAEKYFPLAGVSAAAAAADGGSSGGGGVLLGFEDESGKCWRFRYSYWNSSQSYVLTKGWSRYVKEKKLDAGDVVLFERHRFESDRFFIGWRRRGTAVAAAAAGGGGGWSGGGGQRYNAVARAAQYQHQQQHQQHQVGYGGAAQRIGGAAFPYQTDCFHAGTEMKSQRKKAGNPKRLRLFGVNLECQLEDDEEAEPQTSDGSSLSSQGHGHGSNMGPTAYNYFDYVGYPPNHHDHMDINFPQDVNQMRNNRL